MPLSPTHPQPPAPMSSSSAPAEIIMHDGVTAVYKGNVDLFFYVLGAQTENEVHVRVQQRLLIML